MQFEVLCVFEAIQYTNTNASRVAETLAKHVTLYDFMLYFIVLHSNIEAC